MFAQVAKYRRLSLFKKFFDWFMASSLSAVTPVSELIWKMIAVITKFKIFEREVKVRSKKIR